MLVAARRLLNGVGSSRGVISGVELAGARMFSTAAVPSKKEVRKVLRAKEREKILEDMNRSYFQDIKELKIHNGKVSVTSTELEPPASAVVFPKSMVYSPSRESFILPTYEKARATLVCLAFRASAEEMLDSWITPLQAAFPSVEGVQINEISWVESGVLSFYPIRMLFLMCINSSKAVRKPGRKVFYAFGDSYDIRKALHVTNRLTGYLYLVDQKGRVRWRASGTATTEEASHLVSCTRELLEKPGF